jgi:hypothetical protein
MAPPGRSSGDRKSRVTHAPKGGRWRASSGPASAIRSASGGRATFAHGPDRLPRGPVDHVCEQVSAARQVRVRRPKHHGEGQGPGAVDGARQDDRGIPNEPPRARRGLVRRRSGRSGEARGHSRRSRVDHGGNLPQIRKVSPAMKARGPPANVAHLARDSWSPHLQASKGATHARSLAKPRVAVPCPGIPRNI